MTTQERVYLSRPDEILQTHINLVLQQYNNLSNSKKLDIIIKNIINKLVEENPKVAKHKETIYNLFIKSLEFHDEGKKNPYFQNYIGNPQFINYKYTKYNKHHAEISAIYYLCEMYKQYVLPITKRGEQEYIKDIILSFAYNIARHHSNLENLDKNKFINDLINYYMDKSSTNNFINIDLTNIQYLERFKNRSNIKYTNPYTYYLLFKLAYSTLVCTDFLAVYSTNNKEDLPINIIDNKLKDVIHSKFNNNKIVHSIKNPDTDTKITELNKYRCEMFLESEKNLEKNSDSKMFYLEAPTGAGKSLTSLNLALGLLDDTYNKVFYIAPFNNILEQTHKVIKDNLYDKTVIVNSKEDILIDANDKDNEENINYDKDFLNMQMLNYPVSLISHVKFFDMLFSNKRMQNLMLPLLCNSVIILDEIQSYRNDVWIKMINSISQISKLYNIKFIIMSATLPKMQELLDEKLNNKNMINLINDRNYYFEYFSKRVEYDFGMLNKNKNTTDEVMDKIGQVINNTSNHRILIECLSTATAETFYNELKCKYENKGFLVYKIIGNTNNKTRDYIINNIKLKNKNGEYINKKILLIGTQCIEAGIDIDMDVGFKNIATLDGDEQFCGRVARNFKFTGKIYFFDIDNIDFIYKGDYRIDRTLKNEEWQDLFIHKNFQKFYKHNYKWLIDKKWGEYEEFRKDLSSLNFKQIHSKMKLIDSSTYSFLFMVQYENERSAEEVWTEYISIKNSKISYSERQIKLSQLQKELSKYIYNINTYKFKNNILLEKEGFMYIVGDAEKYFDNIVDGKLINKSSLNLEEFCNSVGLFL